mmetsp:Transcript_41466/g.104577  ORF Transcript_41466/g.104577 Transcript_41466/m.104577 type:complete len:385 (-) Transcript_41466:1286-2440(-)
MSSARSASRILIIQADDAGYSDRRDDGIFCSDASRLTICGASLLVCAASASRAVELSRSSRDTDCSSCSCSCSCSSSSVPTCVIPLALHLNLTEGPPGALLLALQRSDSRSELEAAIASVRSLLVPLPHCQQYAEPSVQDITQSSPRAQSTCMNHSHLSFAGKLGLRRLLAAGVVEEAHLRTEIRAQIDFFTLRTGAAPTHIDGHQHIHVHPMVFDIFVQECIRARVLSIRIPHQPALLSPVSTDVEDVPYPWLQGARRQFLTQVSREASLARDRLAAYGAEAPRTTDAFIGMELMGKDLELSRLLASLDAAFEQGATTCEWMCHPGWRTPEGVGDEFARSEAREHELCLLGGAELSEILRERGIVLKSFHDIITPRARTEGSS